MDFHGEEASNTNSDKRLHHSNVKKYNTRGEPIQ